MKLQIFYTNNTEKVGHVSLIAFKAINEDSAVYAGSKIDSLLLDFGPETALYVNKKVEKYNFATLLDVAKPFQAFVNALCNSIYRTPFSYHATSNNCIHAVLYTLNLCDIQFDIKITPKCKHLFFSCYCYTDIITPREFFEMIMDYQYSKNKEKKIEAAISKVLNFMSHQVELPTIKTPLLLPLNNNIQFLNILMKYQHKMSAKEEQAAIYTVERYADYKENKITFKNLQMEFQAAARDFKGAPSSAACCNSMIFIVLGFALWLIAIAGFLEKEEWKNEKEITSNAEIYLFGVGVLNFILGIIILGTCGTARNLNKEFNNSISELVDNDMVNAL